MPTRIVVNKKTNEIIEGQVVVPSIDYGEIALSYHDGAEGIYIKNDANSVVKFAPKNEIDEQISNVTSRVSTIENNMVSSVDIKNIVALTQEQYDSMSAHSPTTLYVIR